MHRSSFALRLGRFALAVALGLAALPGFSQSDDGMGPLNPAPPANVTPDQIVQRFAAKEKQFKEAREHYTYRQTVKVQTLDGGTVDGEYQEVSDIDFDPTTGRRRETVVYAPMNTLQRVSMSPSDYADIRERLPFVLTSDDIDQYNVRYVGQQKVDELDTYVFDVSPKKMEKGHRYFDGRIWVDNRDLQIVLTKGRNVPDVHKRGSEDLSPSFITYREQVDGRYWFPTYTRADDVLHFSTGDVHIREIVKYTDYKRFGSDVKILYDGQEVQRDDKGNGGQTQQKAPSQPQPAQPPKQ